MSFASAIHDPLALNLSRQKAFLLSNISSQTTHYNAIQQSNTTRQLISTLSTLLAIPAFTKIIATLFRPILTDLCARWLEGDADAEQHLVALCYLIEVHEELFPILYELLTRSYQNGPLGLINESLSPQSINNKRLQQLILAYYRILQANRELPEQLSWPLTPLSTLIWTPHLDSGVRLLAVRCYSLQSGMGEKERCSMEREVLGEPCRIDCQLNYGQNPDGSEKEVDGWILPVVELTRIREESDEMVTEPMDYYSTEDMHDDSFSISSEDLSPRIANVHGILLLRTSTISSTESPLIPLPSAIESLRSIALNVSLSLPILLTSTPSAGKALLLSHLAKLLHPESRNQVVTIHLADTSLDPRALLGSYMSSSVNPGTFEWKEGVLVRSMREGKWVVFEDIDRGSNEVLGVIKPLVESLTLGKWIGGRAHLDVPSRGKVVAHAHFMLFATRSLSPSRNGEFTSPAFFGAHKFSEVIVKSPSIDELRTIVNTQYPHFNGGVASAIINLWDSARKLGSHNSGRDIGLRELQKFCQRLDRIIPSSHHSMDVSSDDNHAPTFAQMFPSPSIREDMYIEARDVFFSAGTMSTSSRLHAENVARVIGENLDLEADRQQWVLKGKTPELTLEKDVNGNTTAVQIGRTHLPALPAKQGLSLSPSRPFVLHKPALSLISRIANAVSQNEPILLTGETGTGKTSVISHLASLLHRPLISLNLSHQTESSDLIGGLKPIDARIPGSALQERFLGLFGSTFSRRKNEKFETEVRKAVNECKWKRAVGLWKESVRLAMERIRAKDDSNVPAHNSEAPRKRRKTERSDLKSSEHSWSTFLRDIEEFEVQHVQGKGKFAFGFVEGPLVKALRSGDWVLLDEVNLASPETLECISGLLHGPTASITLTEHGSLEPVPRHPDFRLFACMNPATDVGKKDLPPTIRSRFTEMDVPPPDADKDTLLSIISQYVGHIAVGDKRIIMDIAEFYSAVKQVAESRQIADGANHRPHFSMRTLVRALTFAADTASTYSLRRSVWEGCLMAFTMVLDGESAKIVTSLAQKHLLSGVKNPRSLLTKQPPMPVSGNFVKFGPFYLEKGPLENDTAEDYIITPSVEDKLIHLSRIILTRRFPVLIEGPTSSGKTSSIEYLAKRTGHCFVRINNHEHTDIQEYLGSYVSDPITGKLVFKDGLLVQALRHGHWIVLDELNLAPTDVLEALNRLLDDNRELVIPETQEVVKPHPHFMLFATQNPPGLYAGRKVLSRAFRNRFLEVHFEDVPQVELETILCQRCQIAPSYGKKIVAVFRELQKRRQTSRVFESKQGFATLRDLFRWAGRDAVGYQELADNGYMLLAERSRRPEDKMVVKEVIETVMGVRIDEGTMYNLFRSDIDMSAYLGHPVPDQSQVIWTKAMQRLYILVCRGLKFNEPILLVGETGSGKTSVCQVFADASSQQLIGLNCHQNTETADIIGGLRPVRNRSSLQAEAIHEVFHALKEVGVEVADPTVDSLTRALTSTLQNNQKLDETSVARLSSQLLQLQRLNSIFEWHDGPLIEAMHKGDVFLLDEISLADDSVLERLNSVLEPSRSIVLAERGGTDSEQAAIRASSDFKLLATMNPGGDYGKKELSPALRNRFTEIWVPSIDDRRDLEMIVGNLWQHKPLQVYTPRVLDFVEWLCKSVGDRSLLTLRDILAWVVFTNSAYRHGEADATIGDELFHHAAHMSYLDGLGSLPQLSGYTREALVRLKADAMNKLQELVPITEPLGNVVPAYDSATVVQLGSFAIPKGGNTPSRQSFNFNSPTTLNNAMRVVRACQVQKPILLEGSPGVGKTSLITALANLAGHTLCRINLSDQTDLIDLFGSDLPVEGGSAGEFAWKDAEFLRALQEGHWVLLDEMNLAPQAVLEGLNAILDHRGTVYIPELNRSFQRHPSFRIFAAQNPLHQGGGRKGLPKSFVNRFTKVYVEELEPRDLYTVCSHVFPTIDETIMRAMISFNLQLNQEITIQRSFAQDGFPWEFNLRDIIRWATLLSSASRAEPSAFLKSVYLHRFRSLQDRTCARQIFDSAFCSPSCGPERTPTWTITDSEVQFGHFTSTRQNYAPLSRPRRILKMQLSALESLGDCVSQSWLAVLTGPKNTGKTDIVRTLANASGNVLWEISVNSSTDTMDILGSFEQVDTRRRLLALIDEMEELLKQDLRTIQGSRTLPSYRSQLSVLHASCEQGPIHDLPMLANKVAALADLLQQCNLNMTTRYREVYSGLKSIASSKSDVGQFEWVDGPLIRAMKTGHWLLLDGANLCGPSVLDRLNSLCESDGSLTLSERGFVRGKVQHLKPHPNFRLFMSVDPHYGELSRAMRNRGIEIALISTPLADDYISMRAHYRLPQVMTPADPHVQSTLYEATRRGLLSIVIPKASFTSSTGRYLDQDSALSYLIDNVPSLISRSVANDEIPQIFFLSRSLSPRYMPYLTRYLENSTLPEGVRKLIDNFLQQDSTVALKKIREDYGKANMLSDALLFSQPMDFYWVEGMASSAEAVSIQRSFVFEIINLGASVFICERNEPPSIDDKITHNEKTLYAHRIVVDIHKDMLQIGRDLLRSATCEELDHVQLASKILHFSIHLKSALSSQPYNFSAMYSISKALLDDLEKCPPAFRALYEQSKVLHSVSTLSTGLGLFTVWSNMYLNALSRDLRDMLNETEQNVASIKSATGNFAIRRQAFNLMSLEMLPSPPETQKQVLAHLRTKMNDCLKDISVTTSSEEMNYRNQSSVLLELYALISCMGQHHDQFLNDVMQEIINMACWNPNAFLLHLVPYQHLLWASEVGPGSAGVFANAQLSWFEGLWNAVPETSKLTGPSILLHPVFLPRVIATCDMGQTSLLSLAQHGNVLQQEARLVILQTRQTMDCSTQLARMFFQTLSMIVSCFSGDQDASPCNALKELPVNEESGFPSAFSHALTLMRSVKDENLVSSAIQEFGSLLPTMHDLTEYQTMGIAWMKLGRLLLNFTVPDTPVDPAAVQASTYTRMEHVRSNLDLQERLHRQLEVLLTGNDSNDTIQFLAAHLADITSHLDKIPNLPTRGDVSRLHVYWSEVSQFVVNVLPSSKVNGLISALIKGDEDAQLRERVMQESLVGFLQRLDLVYPDFADINIFLKLAIQYIRLGIRLVLESETLSHYKRAEWAGSLLAFPLASSSSSIIDNFTDTGPLDETASQYILLALSSLSLELSLGLQRNDRLPRFEMAYEQIFRLWSIDRTKEKQLTEDASTLYRRSKLDHTDISEAEMEEAEFLDMFPVFEDSMEDEGKKSSSQSQPLHLVKPEDMITISSIHFHWLNGREENIMSATNEFRSLRDRAIKRLVSETPESLPVALEKEGLAFQLRLLRETISVLEQQVTTKEMAYNFYSDVNYKELKHGASVIVALRERLEIISEEWPEQMVLQHLMERCDDILKISSKSPVAKMLSMVEQLLVQSEDWQMYANRENTIKHHQDELVRLIVDWRRLELSCWQGLLDSQAKTFTEEISEWWFRLYEAVVRGPLNCVFNSDGDGVDHGQSLDKYIDTLIPLLDSFITTSPLGQFDARMRLLESFGTYLSRISASKPATEKDALGRVHRVIISSHKYYNLFSENVRKHLTSGKAPLETQIRELIKLASWKDINVQALKQSAQRTHRQLYKIIKKFRDLLREPVTDRLQRPTSEDHHQLATPMDSSVLSTSILVKSPRPIFCPSIHHMITSNHLRNLDATYNKFRALIENILRPSIQSQSARLVDDIAVEIITTSKDLASSTVPSTLSSNLRVKHQKALLVRKRKALSDMLKEMKHAGLASSVKPEVLSQNTSQQWIREQPSMPNSTPSGVIVDKGELYFVKLSGSLPTLRESIPTHHSDITTRELQRGQMFLESGFSLAISLRSQLTTALDKYSYLETCFQRIRSLGASVLPGCNTQQHISSLSHEYHKLVHALSEVHDNALILNQLKPDLSVEETFLQDMASVVDATRNISIQIHRILDILNNTSLGFLTTDEHNVLLHANLYLSETNRKITLWHEQQPGLNHLFFPLQKWLGSQELVPLLPLSDTVPLDGSKVEGLLNSILISIQSLKSRTPEDVSQEDAEDEKYLIKGYQLCRDYTRRLNLNNIYDQVLELLGVISSPDDLRAVLDAVLPFFELYLPLAKDQLAIQSDWTKALFKLDYVLCSVLLTLSQQGFCKPPDEGQEDKSGGESTEAGVGIGEGSGVDNVSKEIEDESQIEGLQGEGEDKKEPAGDHEDGDAIEMNDDFGGALEDVPEPGSDEEQDNADADSDNEQDIDETLGNLDELDPSAVDEKLWGDEKGPEDSEGKDEKADQDHSKEQEGSSEVVAKESKEQKKSKEQSEDADVEMDEDQQAEESENDESNDPNVNGSKMDEHVPDANTLDLPEEMDLGEDGMENEAEAGKDDDGDLDLDDEENTMEDGQDDLDDFPQEDSNMETAPPIEEPMDNSKQEGENNLADPTEENDKEGEAEDNESPPEEIVARPDVSHEGGTANPNEQLNPESGENASTGEAGTSQGGPGQASSTEEKAKQEEGSFDAAQPADDMPAESDGTGSAAAGIQQGKAPSQGENKPVPNPLRSLGDALREIQQRFDEILNAETTDAPREQVGESNTQSQIEYLLPDDVDHEMQALGPAGEEQVAKLNQLTIVDEGIQSEETPVAMDVDPVMPPEVRQATAEQIMQEQASNSMQLDADIEGAILQSVKNNSTEPSSLHDLSGQKREDEHGIDDDERTELHLREWRAADYPEDGAERIWRLYESLTHDLAYNLCEQLRLILEPTMATRLKGDYRTGKRLNMKKVIPYIASDYTKDKIWLRRTKPSQREYQVLISIDDSRSMAESHSVHLAYQTLALISKALSRLESGDVAIAKFGETIDLLHGFDEGPFSDQAGTKVMNAFRFTQKATNVQSLLETSLKVLEKARERKSMSSASAADLWQLQIIISDGMCQDHEKLRTILRKAEEQRVMIVFIILDSLQTSSAEPGASSGGHQASILSMDKAEFKLVDGKMELQLQKYLDSFPFEYYVVLRQVEALPEVLAGTLKQFFERISEK